MTWLTAYINPKAKLIKGDIRTREKLKPIIKDIEVIYHQAAIVGAIQSMSEIQRFTDINTLGTANLLDILANEEHSVKKVVLASSMTVHGVPILNSLEYKNPTIVSLCLQGRKCISENRKDAMV